jgi:hypothetical protein
MKLLLASFAAVGLVGHGSVAAAQAAPMMPAAVKSPQDVKVPKPQRKHGRRPLLDEASVDGIRYRIVAKWRPLAPGDNSAAIRIDYSVFRDGKFVQQSNVDYAGGTFVACGAEEAPPKLKRAEVDQRFIGWVVGVECGKASVVDFHFVKLHPQDERYEAIPLQATEMPTFRQKGDVVEMWAVQQIAGSGGPAASVHVPRVVGFDGKDKLRVLAAYKLDPDWKAWPPHKSVKGFLSYFVAGLRERNVALMEKALAEEPLAKETADQAKAVGLPATRKDAEDLIASVKAHAKTLDRFRTR